MTKEKEQLHFKEAVTLFLDRTLSDLHDNSEIPALNFIFPESAFKLFEYIKNHPYEQEGYWIPPLYDRDIEKAKIENNSNPNNPTIIIHNPKRFFELLTDITNSMINQKNKYWGTTSPRAVFIRDIKRIFLRMSPKDLDNIEEFLQLQLDFLKSETLDFYVKNNVEIGNYEGYRLYTAKEDNAAWCETSDKMTFFLKGDNDDYYTLPSIYFATREEEGKTVCYIYAIQNERQRNTDKKIQRKLYKLNDGIENPDVNPGAVLSLKTFIDILKNNGITKIKIPRKQVLSYRYHELLSIQTKKAFEEKYTPERLEYINNLLPYEKDKELAEYEWQKNWYSHVVGKQDFIEEAKTIGLMKIFARVKNQFGILELINNEEDPLELRIIEQPRKLIK